MAAPRRVADVLPSARVIHLRARGSEDIYCCGSGCSGLLSTLEPDDATCITCLQNLINDRAVLHDQDRRGWSSRFVSLEQDVRILSRAGYGMARAVRDMDPAVLRGNRSKAGRSLRKSIERARAALASWKDDR